MTKTYNVTFFNMAGESIGTVAIEATTPNKAKHYLEKLIEVEYMATFDHDRNR